MKKAENQECEQTYACCQQMHRTNKHQFSSPNQIPEKGSHTVRFKDTFTAGSKSTESAPNHIYTIAETYICLITIKYDLKIIHGMKKLKVDHIVKTKNYQSSFSSASKENKK